MFKQVKDRGLTGHHLQCCDRLHDQSVLPRQSPKTPYRRSVECWLRFNMGVEYPGLSMLSLEG